MCTIHWENINGDFMDSFVSYEAWEYAESKIRQDLPLDQCTRYDDYVSAPRVQIPFLFEDCKDDQWNIETHIASSPEHEIMYKKVVATRGEGGQGGRIEAIYSIDDDQHGWAIFAAHGDRFLVIENDANLSIYTNEFKVLNSHGEFFWFDLDYDETRNEHIVDWLRREYRVNMSRTWGSDSEDEDEDEES